MKLIGAGLSKTGTSSMHAALQTLGFKSIHYDRVRLIDVVNGSNPRPDFRRYDDVDAVLDLPAAYFYRELLQTYPDARCILTVRDEDRWWHSVSRHFNERSPVAMPDQDSFRFHLRNLAYGSTVAREFLFKKKYREHNEAVVRTVPAERLLVIDVTAGEGWDKLCPFVGRDIPDKPFPRANATPRDGEDYLHELHVANQEIMAAIPDSMPFVLVDQEWWRLELTRSRWAMPFTQRGGVYFGPPPDDDSAIREFESLREAGARYIVFGAPAFWWLTCYARFRGYLESQYACLLKNERLVIFDLSAPRVRDQNRTEKHRGLSADLAVARNS